MTPTDPSRARLLALVAAEPSPTRIEGFRYTLGARAVAVATMLVVFQAAGGASHSTGRPLTFTLGIAAGAAVLALVATRAAFTGTRGMGGPPRRLLLGVAAAIPLTTLAWLVTWSGRYVEPFARIGYRCLALTLALGCILLASIVVVRRRTVATTPTATGAAFGAVAGAWAAVGVDVWCPLTHASHAAVGHAAPILVLVALGACLGRTLLAVRA